MLRVRPASIGVVKDASLLRMAGRQHGLLTVRQVASLGYSHDAVRRRVEAGVLFRVYRGVYAVAGSRDTFEFRVLAAVLAAGEAAVASGRCAAALYGLRRIRPGGVPRRCTGSAESDAISSKSPFPAGMPCVWRGSWGTGGIS
jgi:hypothetical protein